MGARCLYDVRPYVRLDVDLASIPLEDPMSGPRVPSSSPMPTARGHPPAPLDRREAG